MQRAQTALISTWLHPEDATREWSAAEIEASWRAWDRKHWAQVTPEKRVKRPEWDAHIKASWKKWDAEHLGHLRRFKVKIPRRVFDRRQLVLPFWPVVQGFMGEPTYDWNAL